MNIFTQQVITIGCIKKQDNGQKVIQMLGTGFFITKDKIVTTHQAIHPSNIDQNELVILMTDLGDINQYQDTTNHSVQYIQATVCATDPFRGLAILTPTDFSFPHTFAPLGSFDDVDVADVVELIGYPYCVEGRRVLTYQTTEIGAKILLESHAIVSKHALINTRARSGLSGAVIFSRKLNSILGVLIGSYAPETQASALRETNARLHQTTHCISAEYIKEMI
ncbi:MAG: trypsin-like peptidase domain-containing protein [Shewanellaceae bacterium]|nr:trypsin-like peptidase domain-containing protein [Shewanellaceae bacterium]